MILAKETLHIARLFSQELESRKLSNVRFCVEDVFDTTDKHEQVSLKTYFEDHVFSIDITKFYLTDNYSLFIKYHRVDEHFHKGKAITYPKPEYRMERRRISMHNFKEVAIPRFPFILDIHEINEAVVRAIVDSCSLNNLFVHPKDGTSTRIRRT